MEQKYKGIAFKVVLPLIAIIAVMAIITIYSLITINGLKRQSTELHEHTIVEMQDMHQIRYDILHTAEILTDASATREEEVIEEAVEFRDEIYTLVAKIKASPNADVALWDDILRKYENFYNLCVTMARTYIAEGLEAGNAIMEQVDPVTEELSEIVDGVTEDMSAKLDKAVNDISARISTISVIYAVSSALYIIALCFILFVVIRQMLRPITNVSSALQQLASKDLTVEELPETQHDEIGGLVYAYNELRTSLREIMSNMDESTDQLEEASGFMSDQSEKIKSNMTDITRAVNNVAAVATNQAADIEGSMQEIAALQDVAKQNEEASDKLSEASRKISAASVQGNKILDELYDLSKNSEKTFYSIFDCIEKINESTDKIGEASKIIEDIASQTNLLSLNASIEAARAGDAGRGFAVVADEIRTLSDGSAESVNQINLMIRELRASVDNATSQSENVRDAVDKQVLGVENTRESYKNISENLDVINEEIRLLGDVSRAMTNSCDSVSRSMLNLSSAAQENAATTEETTASVEEVLNMTEEISNVTGTVKERADALSDVVKSYSL
ncbi:MAG: methyl-accepting chemotaxis protein [Lachnospiraceae bacterium]|nr:methyl-accepting chemotaxis protein [Lachnospiraceae bacterium]